MNSTSRCSRRSYSVLRLADLSRAAHWNSPTQVRSELRISIVCSPNVITASMTFRERRLGTSRLSCLASICHWSSEFFLARKRFGGRSSRKRCLILDRARYRYKRFISDIGGQDIKAHNKSPATAIRHVRDWLQSAPGKAGIPGGATIWKKYGRFRRELPVIAEEAQLDPGQLTFIDYLQLVINWLQEHR
jgi:hypothetical protein